MGKMPCWRSPCLPTHSQPHDPSSVHPNRQKACQAGMGQWEPAGFRAEVYQFLLPASPQAFAAASLEMRWLFSPC